MRESRAPQDWYRGQGYWADVPAEQWRDYRWQLRNRVTTVERLRDFIDLTPEEEAGCAHANKKLALAITPYFFNLIDVDDPDCPIRKQLIPRGEEMHVSPEELLDPVGEETAMGVDGLVHRYPDRCLFLVTNMCAAYCRYCTRSRLVSNAEGHDFHPNYENALRYIEEHPEIRDVLLSGGDPLLLSDKHLDWILTELGRIESSVNDRISTRLDAADAATAELSASLKHALVQLEKMTREAAERERLQSENAQLRKQMDKVKSGL